MKRKIDLALIKCQTGIKRFISEEKGDTNFISILIILGIVILLSAVFIGFKDTIVARVQEIMDQFEIH